MCVYFGGLVNPTPRGLTGFMIGERLNVGRNSCEEAGETFEGQLLLDAR
jgi:hypothetical protein